MHDILWIHHTMHSLRWYFLRSHVSLQSALHLSVLCMSVEGLVQSLQVISTSLLCTFHASSADISDQYP